MIYEFPFKNNSLKEHIDGNSYDLFKEFWAGEKPSKDELIAST
jgi:hypothetical protein